MQEKGCRIVCDRCGKTGFFPPIKDSMDSCYDLYDYRGTENWHNAVISNRKYDLCPVCSGQYYRMLDDFAKPLKSIAENFYQEEINGISERKSDL